MRRSARGRKAAAEAGSGPKRKIMDFRVREGASMGALSGAGDRQYLAYEVEGGRGEAILDIYQDVDEEQWS